MVLAHNFTGCLPFSFLKQISVTYVSQIGTTGFVTLEAAVQNKTLESPKCVNATAQNMEHYVSYVSLLGQDFNYADGGGIFFE